SALSAPEFHAPVPFVFVRLFAAAPTPAMLIHETATPPNGGGTNDASEMLISELDTLPAKSVAETSIEFDPSAKLRAHLNPLPDTVAAIPLQATRETPDSVSDTVPVKINCELETVGGVDAIVKVGGVLSRLVVVVTLFELPALSTTAPVTVLAAPSVVT